jgi:hypothetical protein
MKNGVFWDVTPTRRNIPEDTILHLPVFYLKQAVDNIRTSQEAHYVSVTSPTH